MKKVTGKCREILKGFLPLAVLIGVQFAAFLPANLADAFFSLGGFLKQSYVQAYNLIYAVNALLICGLWYGKVMLSGGHGGACDRVRVSMPGNHHDWRSESCGQKSNVHDSMNVMAGNNKHAVKLALSVIPAIAGLQYVTLFLSNAVLSFFPHWSALYSQSSAEGSDITVLYALHAIAAAPVLEEVAFRGITLGYFRQCMSSRIANIMQALLFGLYHFNPVQAVYTFVFGCVQGYFCIRGRSIKYSILLHICYNALAVCRNDQIRQCYERKPVFFSVLGIVLTLLAMRLFRKGMAWRMEKARKAAKEETEKKARLVKITVRKKNVKKAAKTNKDGITSEKMNRKWEC
ncbi:MAG: CPBP family intramembrane metalloprotease [Lachnospiraceae bacterium]|nr:CPBP family intramembrane metalloprotease [Lachnospiraceae bacterium]